MYVCMYVSKFVNIFVTTCAGEGLLPSAVTQF